MSKVWILLSSHSWSVLVYACPEDHRYRITEEFEVEVLALDQPATFGLCDLERVTDMLSASVWSPRN